MRSLIRLALVFAAALAMAFAQTTSGSLSGNVVDAQGASMVGASVTVKNMETNVAFSAKTDASGAFVIVDMPPARYSLTVEQAGFKKYQQVDIVVTNNTSVSVGHITLEVGQITQTVEVVAQGEQLQAESAEQATSIVGTQIENTQVNGRSFLALLTLVPGMYTDGDFSTANNQTGNIYSNGARGTTFNVSLNGASNIDTGSNTKMMATVSLDTVQEFRVMTSNFDAQYGKNSGAQIIVVTKGGSASFHGSGYWYFRDRGLNANSWINNRDSTAAAPLPRAGYHFSYEGYTIGGPVYIPHRFNTAKNKLFFFWSEEYQQQLIPETLHKVTMPTALERQGDFSKSLTNNNSTTPVTIKDSLSNGAAFPGNVIPQSRLYAPGLAVLNLYPLPNVSGQVNYNYQSQVSSSEPRHEQHLKMDYNATAKWRFSGSLTNLPSDALTGVYCPSGYSLCPSFPLTPIQYKHPGYVLTLNATTTISPTMVNEALFDIAHHPVTVLPTDPNALTRATTGINLPTLYTPYEDWIPRISFNGTRIQNAPSLDTGGGEWTPFKTYNSTIEWIDNFSKVFNKHLVKAGAFIHRNRKNQSAYAKTGGHYDFGDNSADPYDTNFGFANAAIGTFYSFTQANQYLVGQYRYTNAEFYVQDSWKAMPRLTVNYGVRAYYIQPYYDKGENTANFLPNLYDPKQAVRLYWPTLDASGNRVGIDRATGQTVPATLIGLIVPGSGSFSDGVLQAGKGISPYLMKSPGILWAPRAGLAWDVTGSHNLVFRAGAGVYYDRYMGNDIFNMIINPPAILQSTIYNDLATNIAKSTQYLSPFSLSAIDYNGNIPTVVNYSAGIQAKLPSAIRLDAAYVGSISRHLMETINLNAVPYGGYFLPQNQDPTKVKSSPTAILGSNAYSANFLAPYQGYSTITEEGFGATANFNSMQVKVDRWFGKGLFLASAFTWSKCLGTAFGDGDSFRIDNLSRYALYAPCSFNIPLNLTFNYVYQLPGASHWGPLNNPATRAVFDGWQLSGLTTFRNGTPYTVGFSIPSYGSQQLTGSDQGARVVIVGDPLKGTSSDPYNRINPAVFLPPQVGSIGTESSKNYLVGPGVNEWQMAVQRNIRITEKAKLQLRVEGVRNVFNHTQFSGVNSTINFAGINNPTITNPAYSSTGVLNKSGFGTINGVRSPRVLQLVARFTF
ncbi:MAG: carboxypeptidase regulatory-like domain-containing protein [Bryobacteraceae bacterium]